MTARFECEISCDGLPGSQPFACTWPVVFGTTAKDARAAAAAGGWVTGYRDGKVVDLCPDHRQEFTPFKRPRGRCSVCGVERALNSDGGIVTHDKARRPGVGGWPGRCPGSHEPPVQGGDS